MSTPRCYTIPLFRGRLNPSVVAFALVDAADYDTLKFFRWNLHAQGYAWRGEKLKGCTFRSLLMHRVILGLSENDPLTGDHINRNRLDNRRANLRAISQAHNAQNHPGCRTVGRTSRFRGVFWCKRDRRWRAAAKSGGVSTSVGYFKREDDAAHAIANFRRLHMPFSSDAAAVIR